MSPFLVIIDNLHIVAMAIAPNETDSPLRGNEGELDLWQA
jgi:hypothetical protein